ncbi:MAG: hypothetical protein SFU25_05310, partial [Candidatus Caenarcaniphilales bacterium]|nr:hypothetical protein [Candidatus Caenarcaniphilales bacterium]
MLKVQITFPGGTSPALSQTKRLPGLSTIPTNPLINETSSYYALALRQLEIARSNLVKVNDRNSLESFLAEIGQSISNWPLIDAFELRAKALENLNYFDGARGNYRRALHLNENLNQALCHLESFFNSIGETAHAMTILQMRAPILSQTEEAIKESIKNLN